MYKCFESVPQEVRQRAFDRLLAAHREKGLGKPKSSIGIPVERDGYQYEYRCCPWGAINIELALQDSTMFIMSQGDAPVLRMPDNGEEEVAILEWTGLTTDPQSVQRFIVQNDRKGFSSFAALAQAMGVEYRLATRIRSILAVLNYIVWHGKCA